MTTSEIISAIALIVSFVSLGFSIYLGLLDRHKLKIDSTLFWDEDGRPFYILISIKNIGRRKIIIRRWIGLYSSGIEAGTEFIDDSGIEIEENKWHEFNLDVADLIHIFDDRIQELVNIRIEDSHGRKYIVKNAKENIQKLLVESRKHIVKL